ncbi:hypothetical protein BDU57DRAFT_530921 [Ampelomyces quisqualis]|uniref:Uncharacterized protein n=1 Tax=Ampelomyces quisqualis TaxID=50730 RepID=A0A6A5QGA5_AMPQU|nr:hypothetical protein BDU57DRAFT_530921 [Ampelomyces quisqualis]
MRHISKILQSCGPKRKHQRQRRTQPNQNTPSHKSPILVTKTFTMLSSITKTTSHPNAQASKIPEPPITRVNQHVSSSPLPTLSPFPRSKTTTAPQVLAPLMEDTHTNTSTPTPASAPTPPRIATSPPKRKYSTLAARTLAPFPRYTSFAHGEDDRQALETFLPVWRASAAEDDDGEIRVGGEFGDADGWEYMYEGVCGCTWPLRRIRVRRRSEDGVGDECSGVVGGDGEFGNNVAADEEEADGVEFVGWEDHGVRCEVHAYGRDSVRAPNSCDEASVAVDEMVVAPRKFRVRVRTSDAGEGVVWPRFKLRMQVSDGGGERGSGTEG